MSMAEIGGEENSADVFRIAGREFTSRLLVGTGRYKNLNIAKSAIEASGAEIVTVALRRVNLAESEGQSFADYISPEKYTYLPNSAGCYTADEAVRTLRLACSGGRWNMVKLEVIGDKASLYPDMPETLKATEILAKEGFDVMVYCTDDPVMAKRLESAGCAAIMPLAAPIGSGLGIQNRLNLSMIIEGAGVPVLVDAGIGTASDVVMAMELGCAGVLLNAAISDARDPVQMAMAMKLAVESGRLAYLSGRMPRRWGASPSSPLEDVINSA